MKKIIILVVLIVVVLVGWTIFAGKDKGAGSDVDMSDWQTFDKNSARYTNTPPYNFTFKYPANFYIGVDIGAIIIGSDKYTSESSGDEARLVISAFPDFDGSGTTKDIIANFSDGETATGRSISIDGHEAFEIQSDEGIFWMFSTDPDTYPIGLGGQFADIPDMPLLVQIKSNFDEFSGIPDGTTEAILSSIKLP